MTIDGVERRLSWTSSCAIDALECECGAGVCGKVKDLNDAEKYYLFSLLNRYDILFLIQLTTDFCFMEMICCWLILLALCG